MPIDRRTSKPADWVQKKTSGENLTPGPYIGIIKSNADTNRNGTLKVWIPHLSGNEENPLEWHTVRYAPPFYGFTQSGSDSEEEKSNPNVYSEVKHSYGMWFVPPDVGVKVLVVFANGDVNRGYWFACIPEGHSHHMVPSLGASKNLATDEAELPDQVPVTDYSDTDVSLDHKGEWFTNPKPIHSKQYQTLQKQGLDCDYLRGAINSGSQREAPSSTYGISTPGRPDPDPADSAELKSKLLKGTITEDDLRTKVRKGGHTFVMDDGDIIGNNHFVRLRTGGGHQILLHDTGDFVYISNSKGTAWIEMDSVGNIDMFSDSTVSIRAADSINFHADRDINMYAGNKLKIVAEQGTDFESLYYNHKTYEKTLIHSCQNLEMLSGAPMLLQSNNIIGLKASNNIIAQGEMIMLNTDSPPEVTGPEPIKRESFANAVQVGNRWKSIDKRLSTVGTRAPTHEPYVGHQAQSTQQNNPNATKAVPTDVERNAGRIPATPQSVVDTNTGSVLQDKDGNTIPFGAPTTNDATTDATGVATAGAEKKLRGIEKFVGKQPDPAQAIGTMTKDETKALYAGIGLSESTHNYAAVNAQGFVGKYQFGAASLTDGGYIKKEYYEKYGPGNSVLDNPDAWTGKDGIDSKQAFLSSPGVQEKVMEWNTNKNYNQLVRNGGIQPDDEPGTVAGMLQTSHLLGASGARNWRETGEGSDANGVSGMTYFARGKYALNSVTKDGKISI